jgi:hypothetical protein
LEAIKTTDSQGNPEQKRAMLEVSQYPTSNYTTEPEQLKPQGTGTKTDMKTNGTEWRAQI